MMLRREFLQKGTALSVLALSGCVQDDPGTVEPGEDIELIDAHCHVFNASDLPAARFLRQVVFEDYPRQSSRTFGIRDPDVKDVFFEMLLHLMGANRAPSADEEIEFLSGKSERIARASSKGAARESAISDTATFLIEVERRNRATVTLETSPAPAKASPDAKFLEFMLGEGRTTSLSDQPLPRQVALDASRAAFARQDAIGRYLGWFSLFRLYRHVLADQLADDMKRQGFGSIMLAPALVDYDEWLYEDVRSPLARQAAVMDLISQRAARTADGPVVHGYIGFDPLREVAHRARKSNVSSLETTKVALTRHGFIGVKLYPPMGFRPSKNSSPYPRRVVKSLGFNPSKELDQALLDLYRLCVELDAPILAHGYASQGSGPEYEQRGDPAFWIPVFEQFPALRVCLAHFGRFDVHLQGRDDLPLPAGSWEWRIGEFIQNFPKQKIFVDISYFTEALNAKPDQRRALARSFNTWVNSFDRDLDHVIYGSDWIMLGKEAGYDQYVGSVNAFLHSDCAFSDDQCDKIFRRNAVSFLPLERASKGRDRLLTYYRENGLDVNRLPMPKARSLVNFFDG